MGQVNVTINNRQLRMGCADGEEEHLAGLAKGLDDRINEMRGKFGQVGDDRLTIMAALTIADELSEVMKNVQVLEQEIAALKDARTLAAERSQTANAKVESAINSAAERIEDLARTLNQTVNGSGVALG
ncbi:MAG: cell division protein ZapA [Pseudomonadota bacterium]